MNQEAQINLLIAHLEAEALRFEGIRCPRCAANRRFEIAKLRRELEAGATEHGPAAPPENLDAL